MTKKSPQSSSSKSSSKSVQKTGHPAPAAPPTPTISPRTTRLLLAGILLLAALIYVRTLSFGFVYDDPLQISENPLVTSLSIDNIKQVFTSTVAAMYQPFTTLTYAIEFTAWKLNPAGYHAINLLLHLLDVALVFFLIALLFPDRRIALVTALLFAIHPLNAETVAWLSCRSSVLYGAFFLLSLISYVRFGREQSATRYRWYVLSLVLFCLALLSKTSAMALPVLLFAFDYFLKRRIRFSLVWEKLPFFACALAAALAALKIRGEGGYIADLSQIYTPVDRLFMVCYSFGFYPFKSLFPFVFSAFYPFPVKSGATLPAVYYAAPFLILLAGLLLFRLIKDRRSLLLAAALYAIPISLSLQFVPVGKQITADRYAYLPCIGIFCLIAYLGLRYAKGRLRVPLIAALALFTLLCSSVSFIQAGIWKNNMTLWSDVVRKAPHSDMGYLNRAIVYGSGPHRDLRLALDDCNRAIALRSRFANAEMAYNNRANVWKEWGKLCRGARGLRLGDRLPAHVPERPAEPGRPAAADGTCQGSDRGLHGRAPPRTAQSRPAVRQGALLHDGQ